MKTVVIASAVRTAIGSMGGSLREVSAEELSMVVLKSAIQKAKINGNFIDQIIIGQARQSSNAPNIARIAGLKAGIPEEVPAYTVHSQSASGLQTIINAVWQIQAGYGEIIVSAGVESMSNAPYFLRKSRYGQTKDSATIIDSNLEGQIKAQPEEIYGKLYFEAIMENMAEKCRITREEQDEFAFQSHKKALKAISEGKFLDEIVPVNLKKNKQSIYFCRDELSQNDCSLEMLASLEPILKKNGTITIGNSSSKSDGAAAVVVMSEEKAKQLNIKPLVRFVSAGVAGVNPTLMGFGSVPSTKMALKKAGLNLNDIGLIELNESFAVQSIAVINRLNLNSEIVNVNGGTIALGHPLGCSGARMTVSLIHEMLRRKVKYGLVSLCAEGGLGVSAIFENYS